ncbi:MAG: class I SAM-dependent methyltransferase [Deltaproteobacteria bacterium]|nr:class I SAM-dependent methyltransferase [Deltaproteobacteria bacterium]
MSSVKFSAKLWNTTATRLAVLIVIVVQPIGPGVGWTQEPVQPRINEEFAKQEKIYRRRGADVPGSYVTNRGLSNYAEVLPTGFCDALGSLGSSDRWLDIGAGEGQAILDYYAPQDDAVPAEKCGGSGPKARAVAISIEDRRTDKWQQQAARLGDDRIRYLSGKRLRQYSREELGKFRIITDVYGGFTYSENLSRFLERVLSLLEIGGAFYTVLPSVHLEDGTDKLGTWYLTELVDPASRPVTVCSWLKQTTCTKVTCESKSDWDAPTQLIKIRKVCSDVSVPTLKIVEYMAGAPPGQRFQLEPQR